MNYVDVFPLQMDSSNLVIFFCLIFMYMNYNKRIYGIYGYSLNQIILNMVKTWYIFKIFLLLDYSITKSRVLQYYIMIGGLSISPFSVVKFYVCILRLWNQIHIISELLSLKRMYLCIIM